VVEILTDTCLQRALDEDVLGRAYGLALPASIGGIVAGALIAPVLARTLGVSGTLVPVGAAVLAYALVMLRRTRAIPGTAQTAQTAMAGEAHAS